MKKKLILGLIPVLLLAVFAVVYAAGGNCATGCTEEIAHSYVNGQGIIVTHCPYQDGQAICCTNCPGEQ